MGRGCQTGILDWWGRRGPHVLRSRGFSDGVTSNCCTCQATTQVTMSNECTHATRGWNRSLSLVGQEVVPLKLRQGKYL